MRITAEFIIYLANIHIFLILNRKRMIEGLFVFLTLITSAYIFFAIENQNIGFIEALTELITMKAKLYYETDIAKHNFPVSILFYFNLLMIVYVFTLFFREENKLLLKYVKQALADKNKNYYNYEEIKYLIVPKVLEKSIETKEFEKILNVMKFKEISSSRFNLLKELLPKILLPIFLLLTYFFDILFILLITLQL